MTVFEHIEISLAQQCMFFLWSVLLGAVMGVIYDVFRILHIAVPHNGVIVFFEDLLFCMITCCMMILMIFCANYGIVRWFSVFGCGGGFFVYRETVGKIVMGAAGLIIAFIKNHIISPVFMLLGFVLSRICKLAAFAAARFGSMMSALKRAVYRRRLYISAKNGFGL